MRIQKLTNVDAFVALDLDGAEAASGPLRWARKILQGGAKDLARSQTYTYAALEMKRGGASAGISADPDHRTEAIESFVAEAESLVSNGVYLPDPAKGVAEADLTPLRSIDPRDTARIGDFTDSCDALSAAVTADATAALDGASVAITGFTRATLALAREAVARGAQLTAIETSAGTATGDGFDPSELDEAWQEHGPELVDHVGRRQPESALAAAAHIVFVGSSTGAVNHTVAAALSADTRAVVPCARLPVTARGLAVMRAAGIAVPADFVAMAGSTLALWGDPNRTDAEILAGIAEDITAMAGEFAGHDDGAFLGACYHAEAYLHTWCTDMPFGRPLAP